ncbi:nuclear transport factor 2 family protein [Sphingomonas profundi]|uniref:nuclear transport factor 2 family protein n=1 Tax=Alterirhizorhabdus profundi TaxID=2681549 RepID=UPI0012E7B798|nr:nuclear transport factor 2 family protein [Sphingomonas profundi]
MIGAAPATLADLIDRAAIADLLNGYAYGIDRRDWPLYRSIFTDRLEVDLAWSGVDASMPADEWVATVRATLAPFDATQHRMTNIAIDLGADEAILRTQMTARHMLVEDGAERHHLIGGYYTHRVVRAGGGWRIARLGLTIMWEQGDRGLFDRAAARGPRTRADVGEQGMQAGGA